MLNNLDVLNIYNKIDSLLSNKEYVVIAIDGSSCSGKSYLSSLIFNKYKSITNIVHVDDYYLPKDSNNKNKNEYDGNIDYKRLKEEVIDKINEDTFIYSKFDCKTQEIVETNTINKKRILVIEGSFSLNPNYFNKYYDLSIFIKIVKELQLKLNMIRNKDNYMDFINKWFKYEDLYFDHYKIEEIADIVIESA